MCTTAQLREEIKNGKLDDRFKRVYVSEADVKAQYERYCSLADDFDEVFSADRDVRLFSAPGRTEVGGNHTDHNHGRVLAAGINLDAIAVASKNDENIVRVKSRGYAMDVVDLSDLSVHADEEGHSPALVRGVCQGFLNNGYKIGGLMLLRLREFFRARDFRPRRHMRCLSAQCSTTFITTVRLTPLQSQKSHSMRKMNTSVSPAVLWIRWLALSAALLLLISRTRQSL
mgnify:CR=1 FL=1